MGVRRKLKQIIKGVTSSVGNVMDGIEARHAKEVEYKRKRNERMMNNQGRY